MIIGIDCRTILNIKGGERAGVGHYTFNLVSGLVDLATKDELVLFFNEREKEVAKSFASPNVKIVYFPETNIRLPLLNSHLIPSKIIAKEKLDLFHAPANTLPLGYGGRSVITVHDLAIYKHPEWFPGGQFLSTKITVPQSIRKAAKILSVSESTKKDIVEIFGVTPDKILVTPLGVDHNIFKPPGNHSQVFDEVSQKFSISKPYILFLGTVEPRKNITSLIRAFDLIKKDFDVQLVIAGGKGWLSDDIYAQADKSKFAQDIIFTGYVDAEYKLKLLQATEVFAFPSFYEGFGLPVLEALACGAPVVCSGTSSLPEVGGAVPVYFDPQSVDQLSSALLAILSSNEESQRQRRDGPVQSGQFSWNKTSQLTLNACNELIDKQVQ